MAAGRAQQEEQAAEREAIFQACERFLGGGRRARRPAEVLQELAEAAAEDERGDRYGKGDLVQQFEREIAETLGKEDALFFPSGTMTQQIALRLWCERNGSTTVAFHPTCHLEIHEEKAYEWLHNLHAVLAGNARRLLTVDDLTRIAEPVGALLLELPQREIGGQLPAWDDLQAQIDWAHERGAAVHMDGARLWESAPFYGRSHAEIAAPFDSVYVSFYKTLGAVAGAALAGPADFIAEARVWRRRHGGDLFQFFPFVISARTRFHERLDRMTCYWEAAKTLAQVLDGIPGVEVKPNPPHTNMMHVYVHGDSDELLQRSLEIAREERVRLFTRLEATDVPGWSMFELAVSDGADALSQDDAQAYMRRIVGL